MIGQIIRCQLFGNAENFWKTSSGTLSQHTAPETTYGYSARKISLFFCSISHHIYAFNIHFFKQPNMYKQIKIRSHQNRNLKCWVKIVAFSEDFVKRNILPKFLTSCFDIKSKTLTIFLFTLYSKASQIW